MAEQSSIERRSLQGTHLAFDVRIEHPNVLAAVARRAPELTELLASLTHTVPIAPLGVASVQVPVYRLPEHNRSYALALGGADVTSSRLLDAPTVVFKGYEPLSAHFEELLKWMAHAPFHRFGSGGIQGEPQAPIGDHFPLAESKVPGTVTLSEAMAEAKIAAELQKLFLRHYGELAPIPTPLLVHSYDELVPNQILPMMRRTLSARAIVRIEELMRDGAAGYTYFFPTSPLRVGDLATPAGRELLSQHSELPLDYEAAIRSWVRLFVRLTYLGYFIYTPWNFRIGACLDLGNAAVRGGCCDVDSIVPFSASPSNAFLLDSMALGLNDLRDIAAWVFSLSANRLVVRTLTDQYLASLIEEFVESEKRPGLEIDPRITAMLLPSSFGDLVSAIGSY